MSRFDRCDESLVRAWGTGIPVASSASMVGICIRAAAAVGLVSLIACTAPTARHDGDQARTDTPAPSSAAVLETSDEVEDGQVSLVPPGRDFAGIAATIGTPSIYAEEAAVEDVDSTTPVPDQGASSVATASSENEAAGGELIEVAIAEGDAEVAADLEGIQAMLRRLAAEADDPVPYHLAASMLPIIGLKGSADAEPDPFLVPEAELDGEEAVMLGEVATFATGLRTRIDAGESTRAVLLEELEGLLERLERGSRLTIAVAELCREVRGAGDYQLLPRVFASGRPQEVLIYVDLNGEEWTEIDGGEWEWAVDWKLELHQVSDQSVADQTDWNRQQTRRAYPVDDNYLLIRYTIPAEDLASALYVLKVRFREPGTKRETETGIQFQLVPRRTIAVQGG